MENGLIIKPAVELFVWKKVPYDPARTLAMNIISGDANTWLKLRKEHYTKFEIVNEYISSQYMVIQNPDYVTAEKMALKRSHIPQVIPTVIICSVLEFHGEEEAIKKFLK